MNRVMLLFMALVLGGCGARFIDERPAVPDLSPPPDLAGADIQESQVASGSFEGRHGYSGAGRATLVDLGNGQFELRFGDDFSASPVPGPVVYLSSRASLGNSINDATDISLGRLQRNSGAQSYVIPVDPGERRYAWVYCAPFNVEVAVAALAP